MFRTFAISASVAVALAASAPAQAETVQVGLLQCGGGTSVGWLIGSSTGLNCVFHPSNGRRAEAYVGGLNRFGVDIGVTSASGLSWLVFAPSRNLKWGALAGNYGGASANASILVGGGANVLLGGAGNSIALQPVSLQGQTGINVAATVTGLQLQAVAPPVKRKYRKRHR